MAHELQRITSMLIDAQELPKMYHWGDLFSPGRFVPIDKNFKGKAYKPWCGLWASPEIRPGYTAWEDFCKRKDMRHDSLDKDYAVRQEVIVNENTRVFMISCDKDRWFLEDKYNWHWDKIAQDYDAVYCVGDGIKAVWFGDWDLESIVFFNTECFSVGESN